jgi:hypothetical protein
MSLSFALGRVDKWTGGDRRGHEWTLGCAGVSTRGWAVASRGRALSGLDQAVEKPDRGAGKHRRLLRNHIGAHAITGRGVETFADAAKARAAARGVTVGGPRGGGVPSTRGGTRLGERCARDAASGGSAIAWAARRLAMVPPGADGSGRAARPSGGPRRRAGGQPGDQRQLELPEGVVVVDHLGRLPG